MNRSISTLLVPRNGDEIVDAATEPVPHAILRDAGHARPMIHRHFERAGAAAMHEHGQESVHIELRTNIVISVKLPNM